MPASRAASYRIKLISVVRVQRWSSEGKKEQAGQYTYVAVIVSPQTFTFRWISVSQLSRPRLVRALGFENNFV
jgi:hypothetical protein